MVITLWSLKYDLGVLILETIFYIEAAYQQEQPAIIFTNIKRKMLERQQKLEYVINGQNILKRVILLMKP